MRRNRLVLTLTLLTALACAGASGDTPSETPVSPPEEAPVEQRTSHCAPSETVLFSCTLDGTGGKVVSLCAHAIHEAEAHISYRFGRLGAVELEYGGEALAREELHYGYDEPLRGMVDQEIWFEREGYRYTLWSSESGPIVPGDTGDSSWGLRVSRGDERLAAMKCATPVEGAIHFAGSYLDREPLAGGLGE